jgi:pyruvate,water dikinase
VITDPLHSRDPEGRFWTRSNVGEALPGVMTPLGWTLFGPVGEHCTREAFYAVGALTGAERGVPASVDQRNVRIFYGRPALDVGFLCRMGDRMPGTTADQVARSIVGSVPPGIVARPTRRRYPVIAAKLPVVSATMPARAIRSAATTAAWWPAEVNRIAELDTDGALSAFRAAAKRFDRHVVDQTIMLFSVVQPMYDLLGRLVARTGVADVGVLTGGYGGVPENAVVAALWAAAHGELPLDEVIRRYGYHGPLEGEVSGRVWREDPSPLRRLMTDYAAAGADSSPAHRERLRRAEREQAERALLAEIPRAARPVVRALLAASARRIPMRGTLKIAFLQALDVARASARRLGTLAALEGALADPEDVFYLTTGELLAPLPGNVREIVARRRQVREEYRSLRLPTHFTGMPDVCPEQPTDVVAAGTKLHGVGVSPGVVEGIARVVDDPGFADVEPGEILIARTTDPSWASIMFVSAALVVDIGGALSHAAVVARELGIPCVVNTGTGTHELRSGDTIRVDGGSGVVEVLTRG